MTSPKIHPKLGALAPSPDNMAKALVPETGSNLQIDGPQAANTLGLSTQVAAQSRWLTDGPSRRVVLGKRVIDIRHTSPKHLIASGSPAGIVVQALRYVGAARASDVLRATSCQLSLSDNKLLARNVTQATAWIRAALLSIASSQPSGSVAGTVLE